MSTKNKKSERDAFLQSQIDFLMEQLRSGFINVPQFLKLLEMTYGDYLELHPEPAYDEFRPEP
jgi:hypothetical protein